MKNGSERRKETSPRTGAIRQRDIRDCTRDTTHATENYEPTTFRDRHHHHHEGPQIHSRRRRHEAAQARGEQPDRSVMQGDNTFLVMLLSLGNRSGGPTWHASTRYLACKRKERRGSMCETDGSGNFFGQQHCRVKLSEKSGSYEPGRSPYVRSLA